jgi:hypothetical protein
MSTDADQRLAARSFGIAGGALVGGGAAAIRFGWGLPPEAGGVVIFFLIGGGLAILLGAIAGSISTSPCRTSRLGHLLGWVLIPAVLAYVAGMWLLHAIG